ncbi:MAG: hypothetical protein H7Y88_02965 [Phycisphaerales bacterium]|nr:hypothetical protein [Phycisphaerales bacterium]
MGKTRAWRQAGVKVLLGALGVAACLPLKGCVIGALVGGMTESYRQNSTRPIDAKYTGVEGKSFAVVVSADRIIQADYPDAVALLTVRISERLKEHINATGYVPGERVLEYQYNNPRWVAMSMSDLAKALGVERLVFIDVQELRLNDPGNQYLWAGVATGTVGVVEADGPMADIYSFQEAVSVAFPDGESFGQGEMSAPLVQAALVKRFVDRASWLFYTHEEPYYPEY